MFAQTCEFAVALQTRVATSGFGQIAGRDLKLQLLGW